MNYLILIFKPSTCRFSLTMVHANIFIFDNRYARWSLGFVDPPLEIAGTGQNCRIRALNERGAVLLSAVVTTMEQLQTDGVLQSMTVSDDQVDVTIVPPAEVGTFSEEDRSRQVREKYYVHVNPLIHIISHSIFSHRCSPSFERLLTHLDMMRAMVNLDFMVHSVTT